eukprot:TRINITY_DN3787_c1_g1_i1.p1 TRINITY_DN3787_c1_g1~~TRINITY_DN3787_c1_g1_i1.p1  ORF type:complete len:642 (+),score=112.09 TRINITY_DN3787_c1_g1_i1:265-2190(+)
MAPLTETNNDRAGRGRSPPSHRLTDAKYGRSLSQRPSAVSRLPTQSVSSKGGSRPGVVRVLGDKPERGRGRSRPAVTQPRASNPSQSSRAPIPLTTAASKASVPDTSTIHVVGDGNLYNFKKLDLQARTVADLQRRVAQYTKVPAKLHSFSLGDVVLIPDKTLYSQGVRDKSELTLTISEFIAVIATGKDGNELELRFHGMDPAIVLCGQLRRAVAARMQSPFPISLMNVDGSFIPESANDMPLLSLGVVNGFTLKAIPVNMLSPRSKEQASGFTASDPVSDAPYPKTLSVKSKWPLNNTDVIQLYLETDGIWATGSISEKQTSKIPLPPLKTRSNLTHVRAIIFDMLGIQPASQVLFVRDGDPLPQYGSDETKLPLVRFLAQNDTLILATDNTWKTRGGDQPPNIVDAPSSLKLPWCVGCVVCDARRPNSAEWRPQFVQPTWLVEDLIAVISLEADTDVNMITAYYRGVELDSSSNLKSQQLNEGSTILVLIRTVLDLNINIQLQSGTDRGTVFKTTLRGVPPAAVVSELCKRALKACALDDEFKASEFVVSVGGMVLPESTPLSCCRISHQAAVVCSQRPATSRGQGGDFIEQSVVPSPTYASISPSRVSYRPTSVQPSPQSEARSPHVNWPPPPVQRY